MHIDFYGKDNIYVVARLTLRGLKKKIGRCGDTCADVDDTVKRAETYGGDNGDSCADSRQYGPCIFCGRHADFFFNYNM